MAAARAVVPRVAGARSTPKRNERPELEELLTDRSLTTDSVDDDLDDELSGSPSSSPRLSRDSGRGGRHQ